MRKRSKKMNTNNSNNNSYPRPVFIELTPTFNIDRMGDTVQHLLELGNQLANELEKENLLWRRPKVQGAWAWSTPTRNADRPPSTKRSSNSSKKYMVPTTTADGSGSDEDHGSKDSFVAFDRNMQKVTRLIDTLARNWKHYIIYTVHTRVNNKKS